MIERAPKPLPNGNGVTSAREGHELNRLAEVESIIQKRAYKFSNDDPMLAEDLAQQAREAIIRHLRKQPDCPVGHLILKLSDAIIAYRRVGSSVDGKLSPYNRTKHYQLASLDGPLNGQTPSGERGTLLGEIISDRKVPVALPKRELCVTLSLLTLETAYQPKTTSPSPLDSKATPGRRLAGCWISDRENWRDPTSH